MSFTHQPRPTSPSLIFSFLREIDPFLPRIFFFRLSARCLSSSPFRERVFFYPGILCVLASSGLFSPLTIRVLSFLAAFSHRLRSSGLSGLRFIPPRQDHLPFFYTSPVVSYNTNRLRKTSSSRWMPSVLFGTKSVPFKSDPLSNGLACGPPRRGLPSPKGHPILVKTFALGSLFLLNHMPPRSSSRQRAAALVTCIYPHSSFPSSPSFICRSSPPRVSFHPDECRVLLLSLH